MVSETLEQGSLPLQDVIKFIYFCLKCSIEDKEKITKFSMYNLALLDMNILEHNSQIGDVKLMVLASWMNHEETRA